MKKISYDQIIADASWIVKLENGFRFVGSIDEACAFADRNADDVDDFDLAVAQPLHLHDFFNAYEDYALKHNGFISIQEFYKIYSESA